MGFICTRSGPLPRTQVAFELKWAFSENLNRLPNLRPKFLGLASSLSKFDTMERPCYHPI
jgi:hypothetical protein